MSDMLERAGVAVMNQWHSHGDCPGDMYQREAETLATAALDAALDDVVDAHMLRVVGEALDREIVFQTGEPTGFEDAHREALARCAVRAILRVAHGNVGPDNPARAEDK